METARKKQAGIIALWLQSKFPLIYSRRGGSSFDERESTAGSYPAQANTGSRGYFGKRESRSESRQR
jgi:hypothetical protein